MHGLQEAEMTEAKRFDAPLLLSSPIHMLGVWHKFAFVTSGRLARRLYSTVQPDSLHKMTYTLDPPLPPTSTPHDYHSVHFDPSNVSKKRIVGLLACQRMFIPPRKVKDFIYE